MAETHGAGKNIRRTSKNMIGAARKVVARHGRLFGKAGVVSFQKYEQ